MENNSDAILQTDFSFSHFLLRFCCVVALFVFRWAFKYDFMIDLFNFMSRYGVRMINVMSQHVWRRINMINGVNIAENEP